MPEGFLTTAEVARALGLPLRTVQHRIKMGKIRAERIGGHTLVVPASEVERLKGVGRLKPGPKLHRGRTNE